LLDGQGTAMRLAGEAAAQGVSSFGGVSAEFTIPSRLF
jgi:hypothetical protein